MNIVEALAEPESFGGLEAFRDLATWRVWLAFLRAFYGLPMDEADLALFRRHTGRTAPLADGYDEAVVVVGVRSGKTRIAAAFGAYEAIQANLRGARGQFVPFVAQDQRGGERTLLEYVREAFERPLLATILEKGGTADRLVLNAGVSVAVYPGSRPAAIRGITAAAGVIDELAHFTATDGRPTDNEMLRAMRGRLLTTHGKLLILSSPYFQSGALWELHQRHFGQDESRTLVWNAASAEMNPTLDAGKLERLRQEDPEGMGAELGGEFRAGNTTLFDPEYLAACVVEAGCHELQRAPGVSYRAFVDPSGGRADPFTVAIGHARDGVVVVDVVRAWPPPFNPSGVVAEAAQLVHSYGVHQVTGDRYAGEWPREAFRFHGITYELSALDRSDLYLEMLPVVNARAVELLDVATLLRELRGLERRRGTAGRDKVDHRRGSHDDQANAVAGLISLLRARTGSGFGVERSGQEFAAAYDVEELEARRIFPVLRVVRGRRG